MVLHKKVATVVEYYTRWMAKWPTVEHLAASTLEEVQEAWSGLGYYSRWIIRDTLCQNTCSCLPLFKLNLSSAEAAGSERQQ